MKKYIYAHRKIVGYAGAFVASIIAMIYLVVVPSEAQDTSFLVKTILLYGHSACWILLSLASFVWANGEENRWPTRLAYSALCVYGLFIGTLIITKSGI